MYRKIIYLEKKDNDEIYKKRLEKFPKRQCVICLKELINDDTFFIIGCDCNIFYCSEHYNEKVAIFESGFSCEICKKPSKSLIFIKSIVKIKAEYNQTISRFNTEEKIRKFGERKSSKIFIKEEINGKQYIINNLLKKMIMLKDYKAILEKFKTYFLKTCEVNEKGILKTESNRYLLEILDLFINN